MNAWKSISMVSAIVALAAPAANATSDRSPRPAHAKSAKKVSGHRTAPAKTSSKGSGGVGVMIISSTPPAASLPSSDDCEYTSNCSAEQLCLIWRVHCESVVAQPGVTVARTENSAAAQTG